MLAPAITAETIKARIEDSVAVIGNTAVEVSGDEVVACWREHVPATIKALNEIAQTYGEQSLRLVVLGGDFCTYFDQRNVELLHDVDFRQTKFGGDAGDHGEHRLGANCCFDECSFDGFCFPNRAYLSLSFQKCEFNSCILAPRYVTCDFRDCDFWKCFLDGTVMDQCILDGARFAGCDLGKSAWTQCGFLKFSAEDCNCEGMRVRSGRLFDVRFLRSNLRAAEFTGKRSGPTVTEGEIHCLELRDCDRAEDMVFDNVGFIGDLVLDHVNWDRVKVHDCYAIKARIAATRVSSEGCSIGNECILAALRNSRLRGRGPVRIHGLAPINF